MTVVDHPPSGGPPPSGDAGDVPSGDTELVAVKKHSAVVRWLHWINAPVFLVMVWSGMRIYWADLRDPYAFGILGWQWFEFWPDGVNSFFELESRLAKGLAFHLVFGWVFTLTGVAWTIHLARRGRWRRLVPDRQGLRDVPAALLHDLGLRKDPPPRGTYNPVQQLSYTGVWIVAFLLVASGFAIYKPVQLSPLLTLFGGYDPARWVHFTSTILLLLFIVVHVVQVARSGRRNAASIVTGYRVEERPVSSVETGDPVERTPVDQGVDDGEVAR